MSVHVENKSEKFLYSYSLLYKRKKYRRFLSHFSNDQILQDRSTISLRLPSRDIALYFERAFGPVFDCLQNGVVRSLMKFS